MTQLNSFKQRHLGRKLVPTSQHAKDAYQIKGVTPAEIIVGLFIYIGVIAGIQVALMVAISYISFLYNFSIASIFLAYCILFLHSLSGASIGLLVSAMCDHMYEVLIAAGAVTFSTSAVMGAFYPIESAHYFYQYFMLALPQALPFKATFAIFSPTGISINEFLYSSAVSCAWILMLSFVSLKLITRN